MQWLHYLAYFWGGAFLSNAIPHLVSGVMDARSEPVRQTARRRPLQIHRECAVGLFNLAVGYLLVCRVGDFDLRSIHDAIALGIGRSSVQPLHRPAVRPISRRLFPRSRVSGHLRGTFRHWEGYNYRVWVGGSAGVQCGIVDAAHRAGWIVLTELTHRNATAGELRWGRVRSANPAAPLTGFAADHLDRRKVLFCTQAAMEASALGLGLLVVTGLVQLWHVYMFAFLLGRAAAFHSPARQKFVAELVEELIFRTPWPSTRRRSMPPG